MEFVGALLEWLGGHSAVTLVEAAVEMLKAERWRGSANLLLPQLALLAGSDSARKAVADAVAEMSSRKGEDGGVAIGAMREMLVGLAGPRDDATREAIGAAIREVAAAATDDSSRLEMAREDVAEALGGMGRCVQSERGRVVICGAISEIMRCERGKAAMLCAGIRDAILRMGRGAGGAAVEAVGAAIALFADCGKGAELLSRRDDPTFLGAADVLLELARAAADSGGNRGAIVKAIEAVAGSWPEPFRRSSPHS